MTNRTQEVNAWQQLAMTAPEAVEITLRVGVVTQSDHMQFQIEIRDATSGDLIGMSSRPHVPASMAAMETEFWLDAMREAIYEHSGPF